MRMVRCIIGHRYDDPLKRIPRVFNKLYSKWIIATYPFASVGRNVFIHPSCDFRRYLAHRIRIGNSVEIHKDVQLGISPPDEEGEPVLIIEDGCLIARRSQISARNCVHIERNVIVSASVLIMDHNHEYEDIGASIREQGITAGGRIRIGQGCWIGHAAAIVCGKGELVLGRNCVVGANAVVTRSVPPYSVVAGNPARIIRRFDHRRKAWVVWPAALANVEASNGENVT